MRITELFDNGEFVVTAEVGPPKGIHLDHLVEEAKEYLSGIHAVNVTDNQSSVMRTSTLATCAMMKNAGLTPIYQATCRDRNRLALQSDLLGAAALGIENILCLTGDHTKMGDHPGAKPVFDLDSVSLLYTASQLEKGVDLSGITAVNVTDNQSSVMRTSTLATCAMMKNAGLTPIYQATCRDRNRLALQSDLLGAAALGIENILCLTGDHTKMGDHPGAKPVFDLDSVSLLYTASQLEKGLDLAGNELVGEPPKFAKGAVVSPISDSVDAQLAKMERKVMAGADYFQTQAVFESEKFIEFMEKAKQFGKPVQLGVIIPKNAGMCKFMNRNVAGVHVPQYMIDELAADKERAKAGITGVEIAAKIIKECRPYCQGLHIMALGWEAKVPELMKLAGI